MESPRPAMESSRLSMERRRPAMEGRGHSMESSRPTMETPALARGACAAMEISDETGGCPSASLGIVPRHRKTFDLYRSFRKAARDDEKGRTKKRVGSQSCQKDCRPFFGFDS